MESMREGEDKIEGGSTSKSGKEKGSQILTRNTFKFCDHCPKLDGTKKIQLSDNFLLLKPHYSKKIKRNLKKKIKNENKW